MSDRIAVNMRALQEMESQLEALQDLLAALPPDELSLKDFRIRSGMSGYVRGATDAIRALTSEDDLP